MKKLWISLLLLIPYSVSHQAISSENKVLKEALTLNTASFTVENLRKYIIYKGIKHPQIVFTQAILETGVFTSHIFKENNNLFGMKYTTSSNSRSTTATGSRYEHAVYTQWQHSVDDYLLWQQMFKITPIESREDYLKLLGKRYAADKRYVTVLKKIMIKDTIKWN